MVVTGYQTLKEKGDPGDIEEHGPFRCTRDDAWLGFGCYFWDTRIDWAHWWGERSYFNRYIICSAKIKIDDTCFDLVGNVSHQKDFIEVLDILETSGWIKNEHAATVPEVIEYLKRNGLLDYASIRAHHYPKNDVEKVFFSRRNKEYMFLGQMVQICLIKTNDLSLQTFKVVYPEDYVED